METVYFCVDVWPLCSSQRVIQLTALEDWSVSEKQQWDSAVKFMEDTLQEEFDKGIRHSIDTLFFLVTLTIIFVYLIQ